MNQELEAYLHSVEYQLFCDIDLHQMACEAVERILSTLKDEGMKFAKRSQIQSITSIVQSLQMKGLIELAEHQKDKNSKKENKRFWALVHQHLEDQNDKKSLRPFARNFLAERRIVLDEKQLENKAEQGRQKTLNNEAIMDFLNCIAPTYIEHFTSHYYYRTAGVQNG